ncbi:MAG: sensor histidine kinase [Chloroflexi bacterium]|nr:sensor histidine kinase [Chloroflexota bacterium]MDA8187357.1 sensor histidine kinase [Dehalococcoidales bacterium]
MSTSRYLEDSAALLESAAAILQEQQEKLRAITEQARSLSKQWATEQQHIQSKLLGISAARVPAESSQTPSGSRSSGLEDRRLSEEERALKQQYLWATERLAALQHETQRLRWLMKQFEIAGQFLTADNQKDESKLTRLSQIRMLQAQEVERQRLAREIHDGPAQVLANAIFQLEFCERLLEKEPERLPKEIARLKKDVREGLAEVRNFIFDLRPAPLADTGLQAMLQHYAKNYQSRFSIAVVSELSDTGRLPVAQETAIYRIIQEAMQNVQKHSHASQVKLTLSRDADAIVVMVEDNGVGFDVAKHTKDQVEHFGLISMRERSQLIGGDIDIISAPGQGTRVILNVPIGSDTTDL